MLSYYGAVCSWDPGILFLPLSGVFGEEHEISIVSLLISHTHSQYPVVKNKAMLSSWNHCCDVAASLAARDHRDEGRRQ